MKTPAFWQRSSWHSVALRPYSWVYGFGAWLDRQFTTVQRAPIPVISIGNVTTGGAGKTPTALALAPILNELGMTPHFVTRGYGGAPQDAHCVNSNDSWQTVGDEALLLACIAPAWVGANRLASAQAASQAGASLVICDDALQHHALQKDLSFLVIDGPYGLGNGQLLPAGPMRESFSSALHRSHAVIMIGPDQHDLSANIPLPIFAATIEYGLSSEVLSKIRWLAFAGTARPEKFFAGLRELGAELVETKAFADHHPYSETELQDLLTRAQRQNARLITTEKDAVKIPPSLRARVTVLPITLIFHEPQSLRDFLHAKLSLVKPA